MHKVLTETGDAIGSRWSLQHLMDDPPLCLSVHFEPFRVLWLDFYMQLACKKGGDRSPD